MHGIGYQIQVNRIYLTIYLLCVLGSYMHECHGACVEDSLQELVLSFNHVGPRELLYLLSQLTSPMSSLCMDSGHSNLGPHACAAGSALTEPSPQLLKQDLVTASFHTLSGNPRRL